MVLVFGLTFYGCEDDLKESEKPLIIQNIPANIFAYGQYGGLIGVFSKGTTPQQAISMTGLVAGSAFDDKGIVVAGNGPYTITVPLYNVIWVFT
jgi:hypothetical protein